MKLLRVGAPGEERPAVRTDDGRLPDLSAAASDTVEPGIDWLGSRRQTFGQA